MPRLRFFTAPPDQLRVDAVVVGAQRTSAGRLVVVGGSEPPHAGEIATVLDRIGATGRLGECLRLPAPAGYTAPLLVVVGLGDRTRQGVSVEVLRQAAGAAVRDLPVRSVALALPDGDADHSASVAAVAEGALLGAYTFDRYRAQRHASPEIILLPGGSSGSVRRAVARAELLANAVNRARDWVNTPPADLFPQRFAELVDAEAAELGLDVTVLDERALRQGGYGGLIGVGQGSIHPPRLVRLEYRHPRARRRIALAGKGITFDSGGLSLKPSALVPANASMPVMKSDMAGAAAVAAATLAAARLNVPAHVVAWLPLAENMPSGSAQRPSDVLRTYGGTTVEVLNTDAEGRLVLADALARASEEQPDVIVDIATLTGAQITALGTRVGAVMANDDPTRDALLAAAAAAGEALWPMPLPRELRKALESPVADIANMGEPLGGMLTAGVFLAEFVGRRNDGPIPWAHLDIAGPAFNTGEPFGYTPRGGTGFGVRTLVRFVERVVSAAEDGSTRPAGHRRLGGSAARRPGASARPPARVRG